MSTAAAAAVHRLPAAVGPRRTTGAALAAAGAALAVGLLLALLVGRPGPWTATAGPSAAAPTAPRTTFDAATWARIPADARLAIARGLGRDDPAYHARAVPGGLTAMNGAQHLRLRFGAAGAAVATPGGDLTLRLAGARAAPTAAANRVSFRRGAVTEWYANGPMGLEQGFTVARPAGGAGRRHLHLHMTLGGTLVPRLRQGEIVLRDARGAAVLRYGGLSATDARGRSLPVRWRLRGREARLDVGTAGARYPLTVDPLVQRAQLSAGDHAHVGSVAVDGATIVVGASGATVAGSAANGHPQGAAYVFTKPAGGWATATQTAELVASDGDANEYSGNVYGDSFGAAVAISGDTIVASAPSATAGGAGGRTYAGKLYVFTKPAGGWVNSYENAQLSASDAQSYDYLGDSLATDGQTIVAGTPDDDGSGDTGYGAVYVFAKPDGGWASALQTAKLTAAGGDRGGALGFSVGVSGSTIVAGAPYKYGQNAPPGVVYEFTRAGATWATGTQTATLTAPGTTRLGSSVAIDGDTVAAGSNDFGATPAVAPAVVFTKPSTGWATTATGALLAPSVPADATNFGTSIDVSGSTVAVGAPFATYGGTTNEGAVYTYDKPAAGWANATESSVLSAAGGGGQQAGSLGLAGSTLVEAAPYAAVGTTSNQGAAYVFDDSGAATDPTTTTTPPTTMPPTTMPPAATTAPTFATPAGPTSLTYTSTAAPLPELSTNDIIAGLFGITPGSGETVNLGQFTFVAYCNKPAGQCAASTSFGQQLGTNTANPRAVARAAGAKHARKAPVLAKASFLIPHGQHRRVTVKLTKAGRALLARRHRITGYLTITLKLDGGRTASEARRLTLVAKRAHPKKRAR